jgi:Transmembrane protein 33/Nucleoporin POM33
MSRECSKNEVVRGARSENLERAWIMGNISFIALYTISLLGMLGILSIRKRIVHMLSCTSLVVSYGSSVYLRNPDLNMSVLIRDSNFRCLLVFFSLFSMRSDMLLLLPFFLMSLQLLASHVSKNRKTFSASVVRMCEKISVHRDESILVAHKLEALNVALITVYILFGLADLFVFISYASMVWSEYTSNPLMRKGVTEMRESVDKVMASPRIPLAIRRRYIKTKSYFLGKIPAEKAKGK